MAKKRFNLVTEMELAKRIRQLARKYGLTDTGAIRYCCSKTCDEELGAPPSRAKSENRERGDHDSKVSH